MNRLARLIDELSYEELALLKKDFDQGILRDLLERRLRAFENPTLVCPVCERPVSEHKDLVLVFGPEGFRQKARFCGQDCLRYFLEAREKSVKNIKSAEKNGKDDQKNIDEKNMGMHDAKNNGKEITKHDGNNLAQKKLRKKMVRTMEQKLKYCLRDREQGVVRDATQ